MKSGDKQRIAAAFTKLNGCGACHDDFREKIQAVTASSLAIVLSLAGVPTAAAAQAGAVERGAYLAAAAGCEQCHTDSKHGGRPYAGGRALETRFGTIITPNITPDRRNRDRQMAGRAISPRRCAGGSPPTTSHFLTAFPFPYYNRLTRARPRRSQGVSRHRAADRQANRAGDRAPFAAGASAVAVVAIALSSDPGGPIRQADALWNRGAYLVATVGRCGDCHTPRNWLGAPDPDRFLAGAPAGPGGKEVPNITPDPETGIGEWSVDDIVGLADRRAEAGL